MSASRPNIILVFIDDMGWGNFSCFGNESAKTPHIDRLAKGGSALSSSMSIRQYALHQGRLFQQGNIRNVGESSYLSSRNHNNQRGMAQWLDPKAPMLARSLQQNGFALVISESGTWVVNAMLMTHLQSRIMDLMRP